MQLTEHFTLEEMITSETAKERGFNEQLTPPLLVVACLKLLCSQLLEPLRDALGGPIYISSGWRCPRLNAAVGGVLDSQHVTGEAADCAFAGPGGNQAIIDTVNKLGVQFDQMINENNLQWVHLSWSSKQRRMEKLMLIDGKYYPMEVS